MGLVVITTQWLRHFLGKSRQEALNPHVVMGFLNKKRINPDVDVVGSAVVPERCW